MMNLLLTKFYKNYAIIHIQYISKPSYIRYYNIIRASRVKNLLVLPKWENQIKPLN